MLKISGKNSFAFLSCHHGFTDCFEILNFVFPNIIPRGVSTCKILTFQDQYFQKYKAQEIVEFSFVAFFADFFSNFCPLNLWHFEDVPIKCPKQLLYYTEFTCRKTLAKKFKPEFRVFCWFPGLQNLDGFLKKNLWSYFGNHFWAEIVPQRPCCSIFLSSIWSERIKRVGNLDQLSFGLVGVQKCCHYRFTNYFEILIFPFSNTIPRGVSTCKIFLQNWYLQKNEALKIR